MLSASPSYAPYPRQTGALGFVGAAERVPTTAGWKTPARELVAEFTTDQKRAPGFDEIVILKRLAKRANDILVRPNITAGHPSREDEMDWNTAHGLINFYLVHGRGPDGGDPVAPPRGPETDALIKAAVHAVPDKKSWLSSAVSTVTSPFTKAAGAVVNPVVHVVEKIPVIGDVARISIDYATAPVRVLSQIASGARLDHVAMGALKDQLKLAKEAAPYAQTVVSLVPGIGTGVAAAIAAGAALAEGQNISAAAKAAIRGAIPGGALAQAGFDLATKLGSGESLSQAALETARAQLSPSAQKAFDIGLAVVSGEKLQNIAVKGLSSLAPDAVQQLVSTGVQAVASTPGLSDALKSVAAGAPTKGFQIAAGLLSHAGATATALATVRAQLKPDEQKGFDAAVATQAPHGIAPAVHTAAVAKGGPVVHEPPKKAAPTPTAAPAPIVHEPPKRAGKYGPYPKMTKAGVSAPPHGHHGGGHGGGHPGGHRGTPRIFRGGRGVPGWDYYYPLPAEVVTETCHTWGDLVPIPPSMVQAVKTAIGSSGGRPTTMRGDDGALYLFTVEDGGIAARRCVSFGVGDWNQWKQAASDAWTDWSSEAADLWRDI